MKQEIDHSKAALQPGLQDPIGALFTGISFRNRGRNDRVEAERRVRDYLAVVRSDAFADGVKTLSAQIHRLQKQVGRLEDQRDRLQRTIHHVKQNSASELIRAAESPRVFNEEEKSIG